MAKHVATTEVPALLPTAGIQDPAVRAAIEAIQNLLQQRSGHLNEDDANKWLTRNDVRAETLNVVAATFGAPMVDSSGLLQPGEVNKAIDNLHQYLRESLSYQILGQAYGEIDIKGLKAQLTQTMAKIKQLQGRTAAAIQQEIEERRNTDQEIAQQAREALAEANQRLTDAIGRVNTELGAAITQESSARRSENELQTQQFNAALSRLSTDVFAAITDEAQTRATADEASTKQFNAAIAQLSQNVNAALLQESRTRATADEVLTETISTSIARMGDDVNALIASEARTRATADEVLTEKINTDISALGQSMLAAIAQEERTRIAADEAATELITKQTAQLSQQLTASIQQEAQTRASADEAVAQSLSLQISRFAENLSAQITEESSARTSADLSITQQVNTSISALSRDMNAAIRAEAQTRADRDQVITEQVTTQISQLSEDFYAAISQETTTRVNEIEALTQSVNSSISSLTNSVNAAISNETQTRTTKDNALARAINSIWANMGGNDAAIEDGALANAGQSASQATRWNQVVAAVTDPNTGKVSSTSIRQELDSYASKVDGTLNSIYSLRAQTTSNGKTVVGGFALSATNGAGSASGPTIDFGVRADKFFIAATSATPNAAQQLSMGNEFPFIVLTTAQNVYGKLYPPGVYLKRAVIGEATIDSAQIADAAITAAKIKNAVIDTAHIADAAITNAKIKDASITSAKIKDASINSAKIEDAAITSAKIRNLTVETAKVANNAITFTVGAYATGTMNLGSNSSAAYGNIIGASIDCSGAPVNVHVSFHCRPAGDIDYNKNTNHAWEAVLYRVKNGVSTVIFRGWLGYARVLKTNTYGWGLGSVAFNRRDTPGAGPVSYEVLVQNTDGFNGLTVYHRSMLLSELKK